MHIGILGATSATAKHLMSQALTAGHAVRALARRPQALDAWGTRAELVRADVRDPSSLRAAVGGLDVLVAVFGASGLLEARRVTDLYSQGTRNVLDALASVPGCRLVAVTSSGVEPQANDAWFFRAVLKPLFLENMYADMRRMEAMVRDSPLDYTLVRPPYLTNGPLTMRYRVSNGRNFDDDRSLSRADLAHFLLRACVEPGFSRATVALSD